MKNTKISVLIIVIIFTLTTFVFFLSKCSKKPKEPIPQNQVSTPTPIFKNTPIPTPSSSPVSPSNEITIPIVTRQQKNKKPKIGLLTTPKTKQCQDQSLIDWTYYKSNPQYTATKTGTVTVPLEPCYLTVNFPDIGIRRFMVGDSLSSISQPVIGQQVTIYFETQHLGIGFINFDANPLPTPIPSITPMPSPWPSPTPYYVMNGHIKLSNGTPLSNVQVQTLKVPDHSYVNHAITTESGYYIFPLMPSQPVIIKPVSSGYVFFPEEKEFPPISSSVSQDFTAIPNGQPTPTPTPTPTPIPSPTPTPNPTPSPSPTPGPTPTPIPSPTPSPSPSPTPPPIPTPTPEGTRYINGYVYIDGTYASVKTLVTILENDIVTQSMESREGDGLFGFSNVKIGSSITAVKEGFTFTPQIVTAEVPYIIIQGISNPYSKVSGTVLGEGLPIEGATIQIFRNNEIFASTTSIGGGKFAFIQMIPVNSMIEVQATGYIFQPVAVVSTQEDYTIHGIINPSPSPSPTPKTCEITIRSEILLPINGFASVPMTITKDSNDTINITTTKSNSHVTVNPGSKTITGPSTEIKWLIGKKQTGGIITFNSKCGIQTLTVR